MEVSIKDMNEKDNKVLFAILEEPKTSNQVLLIAYPEVKKEIEKGSKLENIYANYSQRLTRKTVKTPNGLGVISKLQLLNLIKEKEKPTSKKERYEINYFGFLCEISYHCIFYLKSYELIHSCTIERKGEFIKEWTEQDKLEWIETAKNQWKKNSEEIAKGILKNKTIGERLIKDFYKQIPNKPLNYTLQEFIETLIFSLSQWKQKEFEGNLKEQIKIQYNKKRVNMKKILLKNKSLISFKELQNYCFNYTYKKYKQNYSKMDSSLFPYTR